MSWSLSSRWAELAELTHFLLAYSFCGKIASVAQEGTTAKVSFIKVSHPELASPC